MENLTQEEFYYSIITIRESLAKLVEEMKTLNATVTELKEKVNSEKPAEKCEEVKVSGPGKKVAKDILDMLSDAEKAEDKKEPVKNTAEKKTKKKADSETETAEVSRKKKVRLDEEVK